MLWRGGFAVVLDSRLGFSGKAQPHTPAWCAEADVSAAKASNYLLLQTERYCKVAPWQLYSFYAILADLLAPPMVPTMIHPSLLGAPDKSPGTTAIIGAGDALRSSHAGGQVHSSPVRARRGFYRTRLTHASLD